MPTFKGVPFEVGEAPTPSDLTASDMGKPIGALKALRAFKALRADVEQFDGAPPQGDSGLFSDKVPLYMKSYLVNWLRKFCQEHGDEVEAAILAKSDANT